MTRSSAATNGHSCGTSTLLFTTRQERYPEAIDAFKKLLNEEELDEALEARAVYTLAMLHFATEDWRHAIDMINRWSSLTSAPTSQVYELLAEAHYQLKEYRKAIPPLRKTIELKRAEGQPVDERSYLLLRSAYVALREYDQVAGVLEELIRHFPGDKYWIQLAGAYAEAGEGRKQLNALELAYLQGYLDTQPELLMLAGLLLGNDLPYRGREGLGKGARGRRRRIDTGELAALVASLDPGTRRPKGDPCPDSCHPDVQGRRARHGAGAVPPQPRAMGSGRRMCTNRNREEWTPPA